jgi:uncharacterized integral membrane protein
MGIKGLIIIFLLVATVIFYLQNSQNITLVFFGVITISLPLSLAILLFVFAGLISSLIIQFFSNISANRSANVKGKNKRSPISPPPNSEEYNLPKKDIFKQPEYITQRDKELKEEILQPVQSDKDKINENISDSDLDEQNEENLIYPEKLITKPRPAAPYAYQPKEKTEIFPQNHTTSKQEKSEKKREITENNIYNAPYRVITPANKRDSRSYQPDDNDNDDDWDF